MNAPHVHFLSVAYAAILHQTVVCVTAKRKGRRKAKGKTKQETRKEGKRLGQEPQEEGIHLRIENLTRQGKSRTDANLTNLRTGTVKKVWRRQHTGLGDCTVLDKSPNVSVLTKV